MDTVATPQVNDSGLPAQTSMKLCIRLTALAAVLLVVATLAVRLRSPFNICNDCALYLESGLLICGGKWPLKDIFDTNPPLIMYLNVIPAVVSKVLAINPIVAFDCVVSMLALVSELLVLYIATRSSDPDQHKNLLVFVSAFGIANFVLTINVFFGQREHLFVLLYMPFFLLRARAAKYEKMPSWQTFLIGVFAGVGLCLKPIYLIVPFVQEFVRFKSLRNLFVPENFGVCISLFSYLILLAFLALSFKSNFFDMFLFLVGKGYAAYDVDLEYVAKSSMFTQPMLMACVGAFFFHKRNTLVVPLVAAALSSYVVLIAQHKGFDYHGVPMLVFTVLLLCAEIQAALVSTKSRIFMPVEVRLSAILSIFAGLVIVGSGLSMCYNRITNHKNSKNLDLTISRLVLSETVPGDSVAYLETGGSASYPMLLETGRVAALRYLHLFPFACGEYIKVHGSEGDRVKAEALEQQCALDVATDIDTNKPKLIVAATQPCWGMDAKINFLDLLKRRTCIAASLSHYKTVASEPGQVILERIP
ncbi:MAG: hypothetical protein HYX67_06695 [Candidatus Melainabacteria bacterium]|nr:hypothetical protein [Candidatus Melainabacteria bacterium]